MYTYIQSQYIEIAQGGVSSRAIHIYEYLAYFEPKKIKKLGLIMSNF